MTSARPQTREPTDADRVALWLLTADGAAMMSREMRRSGCPDSLDSDLARMTMHAAQQMVDKGQHIESIPAWTTITFRRRAMDLLGSVAHRPHGRIDDDIVGSMNRTADEIDDLFATLELADIRRRVVHHLPIPAAWTLSAALSFLSIAVEGCGPGSNCAVPGGSSDEYDAAHWAALRYAGVDACFAPVGAADSPAIRQRRKRRIDAVRALLADAYSASRGEDDDG